VLAMMGRSDLSDGARRRLQLNRGMEARLWGVDREGGGLPKPRFLFSHMVFIGAMRMSFSQS
jgi:hypothetical protein